MTDYHARQMTGAKCGPYNCAAASCAMGIHAGTGGKVSVTSDDVRAMSGKSCVPGAATPSGGLYISDVQRVGNLFGVFFDYGTDPVTFYRRWTTTVARQRLASGYGAVFLGDYDQVPAPYRANTPFMGDHSLWAHDLKPDGTVCWHDPLRSALIRVPFTILVRYWQKAGSPIRGYAGWVKDTRVQPQLPDTGTGGDMLAVATVTPFAAPRRWTVAAGTTLRGYDPARPGVVVVERTFTSPSSARADAEVSVAWPGTASPPVPRGSGFLRASNGIFAGLLIVASLVTLDPAPPTDCAEAIKEDRAKAKIVWGA